MPGHVDVVVGRLSSFSWVLTLRAEPATAPRCVIIAGPNGAGKTTFVRA